MTDEQTLTPGPREKEMREKLLGRISQWRNEGYDTSSLEQLLTKEPDFQKVKAAFIVFRDRLKALKDIEVDLTLLDTTGYDEKVKGLKAKLRNVEAFDSTKSEFEGLKAVLETRGKKGMEIRSADRDIHLQKVREWKQNGYEVARIETYVNAEKDMQKLAVTMDALEKKVGVLDKVRLALTQMETSGFEADVRRLERMVSQMERTDKIWEEVYALREKIKSRRKEIVQAEASSKPVKIKLKKVFKEAIAKSADKAAKPEAAAEGEPDGVVVQFRRIDLYTQLLQNILSANKRLLTLDTLRLAQRALKNDFPKVMFFLIQPDFKIKSMMPDHPDSYRALEAFLNKLFATLSGLLGDEEAKERLRVPAKEYITSHIQEILTSGLDDYLPMFLIIDETQLPADAFQVEEGSEEDDWHEIVGKVKAWLDEGYKVDRLVQAMDGNRELARALFRKTEEEIFWLKELERDVLELQKKLGPRKELEEIRKKLMYPERISEIEDDILSLQMMADLGDEGNSDSDLI